VRALRAAARLSGPARLAAAVHTAAAAVALVVVVAGGSGGSGSPARAPSARAPAEPAPAAPAAAAATSATAPRVTRVRGKALQSARCEHWRVASARQRDALVTTLHDVIGGPTPYGRATTLPADVAHQLFDRACRRSYARGFLLYELYTRAAAFYAAPHRDL
jgi:hypothetical protein